ncbi:hypothetical protein LSTR_LSTR011908 [Laodelphax striatellus]|uniref:Uncharacterized protein n=1 Tax=Laodelphax striatellus TaxID=195883 RepID=A0A482WIM7_LAOST|nr:hypothetical protein LSTR_LSTR011908 [Laodelphax striatellus]
METLKQETSREDKGLNQPAKPMFDKLMRTRSCIKRSCAPVLSSVSFCILARGASFLWLTYAPTHAMTRRIPGSLPALLTLLLVFTLSGTVDSATQSQYSLFTRVRPAHPTQVPHLQPPAAASYQALAHHDQQPQPQTYQPQPVAVAAYNRREAAVAAQPKEFVPILAYSNDIAFDGTYSYNYETGDGMTRQETGVMNNRGTPDEAPSVTGSYSYTDPDGRLIRVNYVADANGFRAEGDHLPTPPPIPEAILRSLEYIAAVKQRAEPVDSNYSQRLIAK